MVRDIIENKDIDIESTENKTPPKALENLELLHSTEIRTKFDENEIQKEKKYLESGSDLLSGRKITQKTVTSQSKKNPLKCRICDYYCSKGDDLRRHYISVHDKEKHFKCEICEYTSFYSHHMKKHIDSVHEGKKPYKCDFCDYICSISSDLKKPLL